MNIHRCRFVPYPPSAINAGAFSHASEPHEKTPSDLRLALGRANGDIEIWNPYDGQWLQETILRGGRDRSIEGLLWTQDFAEKVEGEGKLRLFSIGFSSSITEWDLETGTTLRHANGNYGEIWCFAPQPRFRRPTTNTANASLIQDSQASSQYIAAGCADGNILLFSTEDGDLKFSKVIGAPPTKKPRVLSITWKNKDVIVAGYSDGMIRLYEIRARKFLRSMSLGKPADGSSETLIWSVKCLPDETIISGDSTGEIKVWDSKNYSLVQRLQGHRADVLDIATSADGEMIISGGADRRTIAFKPVGPKKAGKSRRWVEIMHRRFHRHDVKTLATFESKTLSVLVSGGLDTVPVVVPLREWQSEHHRSLSNLPRVSQTCSAPAARLLVSWWDHEVGIWHIPNSSTSDALDHVPSSIHDRYRLASKIVLTSDENITSAHISSDGNALAVSTSTEVKVFALRVRTVADRVVIKVRTVETSEMLQEMGARFVKFSPDNQWLSVVNTHGNIYVSKLIHDSGRLGIQGPLVRLHRPSRPTTHGSQVADTALGKYRRTIISVAFSFDSRVLAIGDISGCIDSWVLEGHEEDEADAAPVQSNGHLSDNESDDSSDDSSDDEALGPIIQGQRWIRAPHVLPSLGSPVLVLSFRPPKDQSNSRPSGDVTLHPTRHTPHPHSHELPIQDDRLFAMTAEHHIAEFEITKGRLSDWSRRNPATYLPASFTVIKDRVMDCVWHVTADHDRLYLYGSTWVFMFDMSKDLPEQKVVGKLGHHEVIQPANGGLGKRKWPASPAAKVRNSGAGDAMHLRESYVGHGGKLKKFKGGVQSDENIHSIDLGHQQSLSWEDDGDDYQGSGLATLRRQSPGESRHEGTSGDTEVADKDGTQGSKFAGDEESTSSPNWWHSFNYRLILGIAPLDTCGDAKTREQGNVEVAIVERPIFNIDLPPRYDGGQDWET